MFGHKGPQTITTADGEELVLTSTLDHPLLSELGPQIQQIADTFAARPLPDLATQVLTGVFTDEYQVTNAEVWSLIEMTEHFLPPHRSQKLHEDDAATDAECQVHEMVAEAVQLLEHAGVLMQRNHYYLRMHLRDYTHGYGITRLGRAALTDGSLQARLLAALPAAS